jgi:pimeloyl-ACP methyl ester carboxylesterase
VLQSLSRPAGLTPLLLSFMFPPDRALAGTNYVRRITRRRNLRVITPAAALEQTRAVLRWAASAPDVDPRRIRARTLVTGGAEDVVIVPANPRRLARRIGRRARLKLYRDTGHGFLFQERSAFAKLVRRFL